MPIITSEMQAYFDALYARIEEGRHAPFRQVSIGDWTPRVACCHDNVDRWIAHDDGLTRVRGWLTWGKDATGTCMFIAHSLVEDDDVLYDITPVAADTPPARFLRHEGPAGAFDAMQLEWSWTFFPFITALPGSFPATGEDIDPWV